jgi:ribosomal protein S18 acetylase RimI-like enzyme
LITQQTVTYLEMTDPAELRPSPPPAGMDVALRRAEVPAPELNRFLYTAVGGDWYWTGRLAWSYGEWLEYVSQPGLQTWVFYVFGTPAGYCEMIKDDAADVEITSFGLFPRFVGKGLGGYALSEAARRAWEMGARRVWLHTWTLDHPNALANYQARGFQIIKQETVTYDLPDEPPGPWPGARRRG